MVLTTLQTRKLRHRKQETSRSNTGNVNSLLWFFGSLLDSVVDLYPAFCVWLLQKNRNTLHFGVGGSNCSFCNCDRQNSNLAPKISHLLFYTFFQFKHSSRWCCEENLQKWFSSQISCPPYAGWVKPNSCFFKGTGHFLMLERCKVWERIRCQGDSLLLALGIKGGCVTRSTGRYEGLRAAPKCQPAGDGPPTPPPQGTTLGHKHRSWKEL